VLPQGERGGNVVLAGRETVVLLPQRDLDDPKPHPLQREVEAEDEVVSALRPQKAAWHEDTLGVTRSYWICTRGFVQTPSNGPASNRFMRWRSR
jgi:hypothetical protein